MLVIHWVCGVEDIQFVLCNNYTQVIYKVTKQIIFLLKAILAKTFYYYIILILQEIYKEYYKEKKD